MIRETKSKDLAARFPKISFLATISGIWIERNHRRFHNKSTDIHIILAKVYKNVIDRVKLDFPKQMLYWLLCEDFLPPSFQSISTICNAKGCL